MDPAHLLLRLLPPRPLLMELACMTSISDLVRMASQRTLLDPSVLGIWCHAYEAGEAATGLAVIAAPTNIAATFLSAFSYDFFQKDTDQAQFGYLALWRSTKGDQVSDPVASPNETTPRRRQSPTAIASHG